MATGSMFSNFDIGNLNTYKDNSHKALTNNTKAIFNKHNLYILPEHIYKHLSKYNGFMLDHLHEYLSFEDIATILKINDIFNFDPVAREELFNKLPDNYKDNVAHILKTDGLSKSVDNYLYEPSSSDELYNIYNMQHTIVIVVNKGIAQKLRSREFKTKFLTDLVSICYNVMGDGNTNAQPFFKEFVDVL